MANKILAFAEIKDNKFKSNAYEVISEADRLTKKLGTTYDILTFKTEESELKKLSEYGAEKIFYFDLKELNSLYGENILLSHSAVAKVISSFISKYNYDILMVSGTTTGREIAPRVSALTESAYAPDCVGIFADDGNITISRPVYAGKSYIKVKFNTGKIVLTLRPNVFKSEKSSNPPSALEGINISDYGIQKTDFKAVVKEIVLSEGKLDVAEADKIVSGGRGLRGPENFHLVEELANVLGAATGASRAVVDAGWRPHSDQVGQTGKTVSPNLYIACGISGAIQHLAGMSSSKCIVAINKDKDAPIFQIADYGIIGDVFEILPALTVELKKLLNG
jgi:electron transfer flavoprotein alpha subunit